MRPVVGRWPTRSRLSQAYVSGRGPLPCSSRAGGVLSWVPLAVRAYGLHAWGWVALAALVLGLDVAAILLGRLAKLKFAIDARELYDELYEQAAREAPADTLGWLAEAGYGYQALREKNAKEVRRMSRMSGALACAHGRTARLRGWLRWRYTETMAPKPLPPDQIKTPSTSIGIEEGRGGSLPRPTPETRRFEQVARRCRVRRASGA